MENEAQIWAAYRAANQQLNYLIAFTPTGKVRDLLTEANIQLMRAEQEWRNGDAKARNPSAVPGHSTKVRDTGGRSRGG